jgi:hypothetical protein
LHAALLFNACSTLVTALLFALLHCFGALLEGVFLVVNFQTLFFIILMQILFFFSKKNNLFFPKKSCHISTICFFETNFVAFVVGKVGKFLFLGVNMNNFVIFWEKFAIF